MTMPIAPMALWDMAALGATPRVWADVPTEVDGVRSLFYEGVPWRGRPTRVFAYYGVPEGGDRVPGMVLVHGGGGSAFIPWVEMWMRRGYAAIAMDTCGAVSGGGHNNHTRHADGGPGGWGGFDQIDEPVTDQWPYHAVAAVARGHSLLRGLPRVDAERIGITGVSWGGYLTCIAAGVDPRFRFAAPVYGCGFLGVNSCWLSIFEQMGAERAERWLAQWDPSAYLPAAHVPMLWVSGTNDFAYPMDSWQQSYRMPASPRTLCLRVRMPHGHHGPGENPPEIARIAEALFRSGAPLARFTEVAYAERRINAAFEVPVAIIAAELNYTMDGGVWQERHWETEPAELADNRVTARVPDGATCAYLNLVDAEGCVVSGEHVCP
jgi:dienelactone hydrolase